MAKSKKKVGFARTNPGNEDMLNSLRIFGLLKVEKIMPFRSMVERLSVDEAMLKDYLSACRAAGLVKMDGAGPDTMVSFDTGAPRILGVGIMDTDCVINVMDLSGKNIKSEKIEIPPVCKMKGRNKDINAIIQKVKEGTALAGETFKIAGVAVPDRLMSLNAKAPELLVEGISSMFKCDAIVTREPAAAGYGERDFGGYPGEKSVLYVHRDVGDAVVVKGELIYEAEDPRTGANEEYLRSWNQFSIVESARSLVNKGVGTSIVTMVNGDVESVTLDLVLEAAENHDELAEDLVKRSGLALGIRVSYLVNIFHTDTVILGGGTEKREGNFLHFVGESAERFYDNDISGKVKILPGVLGKEACSMGAAALCRRELFMEV